MKHSVVKSLALIALACSLATTARAQLRSLVRERLPIGKDARIAYEAFANAVKGRVRA